MNIINILSASTSTKDELRVFFDSNLTQKTNQHLKLGKKLNLAKWLHERIHQGKRD
jgi:hypothetical protein